MSEPVAWTTMPDADDWTFISGHEDPNGKLYGKWFPLYTADAIREAVLAEREACARACEALAEELSKCDNGSWDGKYGWQADGAEKCADDIRARGAA